mmetsp:Transcript_16904/g.43410  ORF Transcript_16904/g.43410 Transcript_16904/m.43410 type:complete len:145 (-) Transcript_16904:246-680(-)
MAPTSLSNLPLQVLLFFNGWYDVVYVIVMLCLFIWKGTELPYPGNLGGILALEVCLLFVLGVLEYCRIFLASRGNKTERSGPLIFSCILSIPCAYFFFYYLFQQVYVSRFDITLGTIGLSFIGLELILSLLVIVSVMKAPPASQ